MNIIPFDFDTHAVRAIMVDGDPWFIAADVAAVLGYSETAAATRTLDDEDKGLQVVQTLGGPQSFTAINESGLYALILGSRLPAAKRFKQWVTREVLPSIRKTGAYGATAQHDAALTVVRRIHEEADREIEHRTQHDYHRPDSARAQEHIQSVIAEVAKKRGLDVAAVALGNRQSVDAVMAEAYGDPVAKARIARQRAAIEAEVAQRLRLYVPRRNGRRTTSKAQPTR